MTTLALTLLTFGVATTPVQTPSEPGIQFKNLTVFPLYEPLSKANPTDYISLDEGLKAGTVVVTEKGSTPAPMVRPRGQQARGREERRSGLNVTSRVQTQGGGAEVNSLWIINKSGKKLMLLAGEMVVGGQQDRILQKDGLIPPTRQAVNLDVFCVEHGRWTPKTERFGAPVAASKGLPAMGGIADPRVRGRAQASRDQGQVWAEVDNSLKKNQTVNDSQTYQANFSSGRVQANVDQYVNAINAKFPTKRAVGAVVSVNGRIIWMDRFASNTTFRKYWGKLLRSYALEGSSAINEPATKQAPATYEDALRYAGNLPEGTASRFEGEEKVWRLLRREDPLHVRFELQDMTSGNPVSLHASRMKKH